MQRVLVTISFVLEWPQDLIQQRGLLMFALYICHGTLWNREELSAITQVKQIKSTANWLIGKRLYIVAKSKFSRKAGSIYKLGELSFQRIFVCST